MTRLIGLLVAFIGLAACQQTLPTSPSSNVASHASTASAAAFAGGSTSHSASTTAVTPATPARSFFVTYDQLTALMPSNPDANSVLRDPSHWHFWVYADAAAKRFCLGRNEGWGGGIYSIFGTPSSSGMSILCFAGTFRDRAPLPVFLGLVPGSDCNSDLGRWGFLHCATAGARTGYFAHEERRPALINEFGNGLVGYSYPRSVSYFNIPSFSSIAERAGVSLSSPAPLIQTQLRLLATRWCTMDQALPSLSVRRLFAGGVVTEYDPGRDLGRIACLGNEWDLPVEYEDPWGPAPTSRYDQGASQPVQSTCATNSSALFDIDFDGRYTNIDERILLRILSGVDRSLVLAGLSLSPSARRATANDIFAAFDRIRIPMELGTEIPIFSTANRVLVSRFVRMLASYPERDVRKTFNPGLADGLPRNVVTKTQHLRLEGLSTDCIP